MSLNNDAIVVACELVNESLLKELASLYSSEPYKAAIWGWQFRPRFGRDCLAIVARQAGKLVGFNATMPVKIQVGEYRRDAVWSCDFIVAEGMRGKGIGNAIKAKMLESIDVPIMSMGISDDALPILIKKGWAQGPIVPVYKKICRPKNSREYLLNLLSILGSLRSSFFNAHPINFTARFYDDGSLPDAALIEELLILQLTNQNVSVVKDHAYLTWRYQQYPWREYVALLLSAPNQKPVSLLIYRMTSSTDLEVVDYLGEQNEAAVVSAAIRELLSRHVRVASITWSCSSEKIHHHLRKLGFLKRSYGSRFVCFDPGGEIKNDCWLLAAGDSDGDFLKAAKKNVMGGLPPTQSLAQKNQFTTIRIDEQKFLASAQEWGMLLAASDCDALFMSWAWQSAWWLTWKNKLNLELYIHFIFLGGDLVGILPLYRRPESRAGRRELQFIGNAWRIAPSVRSEYIAPLFKATLQQALTRHVDDWLASSGWFGHMYMPDHVLRKEVEFRNTFVRQSDTGYVVDTSRDIHEYKASLGAQTRLKAFNRLHYLEHQYPGARWEVVSITEEGLENFFATLNSLHVLRWDKPCFDEYAQSFHKRIIASGEAIVPFLHQLCINGEVVSVSYNLICKGKMYNIQSGYLQNFDKKLSLGTLHFGKLLQICFESPEIKSLDFLAGSGKNTDYKNHFNGAHIHFVTLQIFSSKVNLKLFTLKKAIKARVA